MDNRRNAVQSGSGGGRAPRGGSRPWATVDEVRRTLAGLNRPAGQVPGFSLDLGGRRLYRQLRHGRQWVAAHEAGARAAGGDCQALARSKTDVPGHLRADPASRGP